MVGYFTGTAFMYALDPERFRVDFKTYQFVRPNPAPPSISCAPTLRPA
jgi:hypothetical protein